MFVSTVKGHNQTSHDSGTYGSPLTPNAVCPRESPLVGTDCTETLRRSSEVKRRVRTAEVPDTTPVTAFFDQDVSRTFDVGWERGWGPSPIGVPVLKEEETTTNDTRSSHRTGPKTPGSVDVWEHPVGSRGRFEWVGPVVGIWFDTFFSGGFETSPHFLGTL